MVVTNKLDYLNLIGSFKLVRWWDLLINLSFLTSESGLFYFNNQGLSNFSDMYHAFGVVQTLNSPFFPPPLEAEPGRAKRESRVESTVESRITHAHA